jgi:membrane associated rhomboid family serine protease
MFVLRGLAASLLWLVAGLLGLLGVVLSVTIILLPLGVPLLILSKKVFGYSMALLVPRKARHPVGRMKRSGSKAFRWLTS